MATRVGALAPSPFSSANTPSISTDLQLFAGIIGWPAGESEVVEWQVGGARSRSFPVASLSRARAGYRAKNYTDDFYNRVYIETALIDAGGVVGTQERSVWVWNAYLDGSKTLSALVEEDAEGINVLGQPAPPLAFRPLQVRTYTIQITTDGPPTIAALLTWDFADANDVSLAIVGSRVIGWAWPPDWKTPIVERLEWMTDVIPAYRGEEQRRALRLRPRKSYEFAFATEGRDRRLLESAVWNWGARVWAVPLWHEGQSVTTPVAAGASTVVADPTDRDLQAGGLAMFVGATARDFEVVEIESAAPGAIVLKRPTAKAWGAGAMFYPARAARLSPDVALPRFTGDVVSGRARFDMTDPDNWTANDGGVLYRDLPVLELRPNWTAGVEPAFERTVDVVDAGTGAWAVDDRWQLPAHSIRAGWTFLSRADVAAWRARLYALRGRQGAFWMPSWSLDLALVAQVLDAVTSIDVEHQGVTSYLRTDPNRRDIRVELVDGSIFYRRIVSSLELDADTERLNLDAAFGRTINPGDVVAISFLTLVRLNSDAIELAFWTGDVAESAATLRSFRHDL